MNNVPDIVESLGGPGKLAKALGVKPSAASEMKRRQSIPVHYWPKLVLACREQGVDLDYETLVTLHSRQQG